MLSKEVMFLIIIALLAVIVWTQVNSPEVEVIPEVVVSYHPEVNVVCFSNSTTFFCKLWWELIEPWTTESPNDTRARIFGVMN